MLLAELRSSGEIDWSRAEVDSSTIRAVGGGEDTGPNSTDRGGPGSKHHVVVDGHGVPLEVQLSAANKPDVMQLVPLLANLPQVTGAKRDILGRDRKHLTAIADTIRNKFGNYSDGLE